MQNFFRNIINTLHIHHFLQCSLLQVPNDVVFLWIGKTEDGGAKPQLNGSIVRTCRCLPPSASFGCGMFNSDTANILSRITPVEQRW